MQSSTDSTNDESSDNNNSSDAESSNNNSSTDDQNSDNTNDMSNDDTSSDDNTSSDDDMNNNDNSSDNTNTTDDGNSNPVVGDPSSDVAELLNMNFNIIDGFDNIQDWEQGLGCNGSACGNVYVNYNPEYMPKLLNGELSKWGYYSNWNTNSATQNWIGGGETRPIWRGSKSASIDLGGSAGPSRLGRYLGKSYKDLSLFYMVNIPKNMFPTSCDGGKCQGGEPTGYYEEGKPYTYISSWKFNTFNMNCGSNECPNRGTYGTHYMVPHIKQNNYGPAPGLIVKAENKGGAVGSANDNDSNLNSLMGDWWGVEFRLRNIDNDTKFVMDIWIYDHLGNSQHVLRGEEFPIDSSAHGGGWDHFLFGGNNSNSWTWGSTMQSHYYVDDFIVDDGSKGRIGPRYFAIISQ